MESISLERLKPVSLLDCGFEYRELGPNSNDGYEEYYFKIPGNIISECETTVDEKSWFEIVLIYKVFVFDSPFCETEDNFQSDLQEIYLRAVTKTKRDNFIKKSETRYIDKPEFLRAGASVIITLDSINTDDELFTLIKQLGGELDTSQYKPRQRGNPFKNAPTNYF